MAQNNIKGQTQKMKEFLTPHLDNRIVFNKLVFIESKKFNIKDLDKSLYLIFGAYNNATDEMQKVTYEPKTGYLHIKLHYAHVSPLK